jgi:hypothetical protein
VKDTNNILPYNLWSGTDYEEIINFSKSANMNVISSSENSYNGEKSYKIQSNNQSLQYAGFDMSINNGQNITVSLAIYNPNKNLTLRIQDNNNITDQVSIEIPPNNNWAIYSISFTAKSNTSVRTLFIFSNGGVSYLDNINAIIL